VSDNLYEMQLIGKTGKITVMAILLACLMCLLFNARQSYNSCSLQEQTLVWNVTNSSGWLGSVAALIPIISYGYETE